MSTLLYVVACWPVVAFLLVAAICRTVHKSKLRGDAVLIA